MCVSVNFFPLAIIYANVCMYVFLKVSITYMRKFMGSISFALFLNFFFSERSQLKWSIHLATPVSKKYMQAKEA